MLRLAAAALIALGATFAAAAQDAPVLNFTITGANPGGGGAYQGTAKVQQAGEGVVNVEQTVNGKTTKGYGVMSADSDTVAIYLTDPAGANALLLLEIADDGSAKGLWTTPGATGAGAEEWTMVK